MKVMTAFSALLLAAGCGAGDGLTAVVGNPSDFAREKETVEIAWSELGAAGVTADDVTVTDGDGVQLPSQVIFDDDGLPQSLLFQASVEAGGEASYRIVAGEREAYETQAYGRYVPERADDYAWENNLAAYRIYGPALADPLTQGVDVWVKSTPRLVINEWYGKNDYHHNYGDGMDCYKVASTLGGGAVAPFVDGRVMLAGNYASQRCTANGPVRTSAEFTYAPVEIGGRQVTMRRRIRLDANTRFSVQEYVFDGFEGELPVAAGMAMHDVKAVETDDGYAALVEAASDSSDPERDGDIMLGIVFEGGEASEADSHLLLGGSVKAGDTVTMRNGSAWSLGGVAGAEEWMRIVREERERAAHPLTVTLRR